MFFGKVVGIVVATRKDIHLEGKKLLVVARTDHSGNRTGGMLVAVDYVQAGYGDFVYLAKSKDAGFPVPGRNAPIDAGIVGIIDHTAVTDL
ncbi:EutN/CcmL family microcompartment protein [Lachnospiraceae bacterium 50-23]